ncbi:cyclopropane-fatty-acyl-phospholipid synthase family protein [Nocardioides marmoribigeumensis]|uniref:Cyclopropane-fatty-acyl-phospholipid synthase n=1 Tax=Nocardioides marmoribigeumensis TaxID=433649 RepID=A0ABU2BQR6_9ACTN|nr:cyclopropane-fatty-acyl-phospholipid synthase family protein [Nocardioides marmoribigeumensis]MDR7360611.1 cyclopropane-fatty-acyl-phospholipid synthase [Nocardioides marmoribigeumensis]
MSTAATHFDATPTLTAGAVAVARPVPEAPALGIKGRVARSVLSRIVRKVDVGLSLPSGERFGPSDPRLPQLRVLDEEAFFGRLGDSPMIGLGEAYMAGEWTTADGTDLADALAPFAASLTDLIPKSFYRLRHVVLPRLLSSEQNTRDGSRHNIHRHYDLSNEMFAEFLDPTMSYSCALFDGLDPAPVLADHEEAQLRKIDAVLDAAGVRAGSRVLEIGTGWGSLAIRAAERGATVTTITISAQQAELARDRIEAAGMTDRVSVELCDYRDVQGEYDAVVSVEMIEAVGEEFWPTYFGKIDEVLAPGGRAAIQAILLEHERFLATRNTYGWIHKYIFPGGLLPSTQAIEEVLARHTGLRLVEERYIGLHYAHTLRLWRERFNARWDHVQALGFDETFRRMWEFYLAYCEAGFRTGYLDDAILTMSR